MSNEKIIDHAYEVDQLLASSDVLSLHLSRQGRAWSCQAMGLNAEGYCLADSMLESVHGAVVAHNKEWDKKLNE